MYSMMHHLGNVRIPRPLVTHIIGIIIGLKQKNLLSLRRLLSFVFALIILAGTASWSQTPNRNNPKLHPAFEFLVGQSRDAKVKTLPKAICTVPVFAGVEGYRAIVYTQSPQDIGRSGAQVNSVYPHFVTTIATMDQLETLANSERVKYIEPGATHYPLLEASSPEIGATLLHAGFVNNTAYKGKGVIVLIYDTGIDWRHLDFRKSDTSKSRILGIWDQTIYPLPFSGEANPRGFTYGVEYSQSQIEDELDGTPANFVREKDINGHGTHVASIAAGNGLSYFGKYKGIAPEADIIVVKGGDGVFYESFIIDGMSYAAAMSAKYGKPVVVNLSLGTQAGPHDGTMAEEVAIQNFVSAPGRIVCVAAGNEGESFIHTGGVMDSSNRAIIQLNIPPYNRVAPTGSNFFVFDIWFQGNPLVTATITSPSGEFYSRIEDFGILEAESGSLELWSIKSPLNNQREVHVNVNDRVGNVIPGKWTITVSTTSGSYPYHGWLPAYAVGGKNISITGGNSNYSVATPGTSEDAITVGSFATKWTWLSQNGRFIKYSGSDRTNDISTFSSVGPTRDGRLKPDIVAPGQGIAAALSFSADASYFGAEVLEGSKYVVFQGTSMATPHITGAAALLLQADPLLTTQGIKSLICSTAKTDEFVPVVPNTTWGWGKIDIYKAMRKLLNSRSDSVRVVVRYDVSTENQTQELTGVKSIAVRFTSTLTGRLTGIDLKLPPARINSPSGHGQLRCEVRDYEAGRPGAALGTVVLKSFQMLSPGINNYVQMLDANVSVAAGKDYFVALSVVNPMDTLLLSSDNASDGTSSYWYDGSNWNPTTFNYRIGFLVVGISTPTSVARAVSSPGLYWLGQNYPNPFNAATRFEVRVGKLGRVSLKVFDILGRQVATLVDETRAPGSYNVQFDGSSLASGIYICRMQTEEFVSTTKIALIR